MPPSPRLLRVRCTTWDQVEAFYRRKLRAGGRLTMKVAFATAIGAPVTLVLELPNQIALSIDGEVTAGEGEGKPVEVTLRGLTAALVGRLESLVADARSGALDPEAQDDETRMLSARRTELARLRRLPAHEVLGVPRDPSAHELRSAWLALARREHPDAVARYASPALSAAATEVMALAAAAFEHVRADEIASGRALAAGASLRPPAGWVRGEDGGLGSEPIAAAADEPEAGLVVDAATAPVQAGAAAVTEPEEPRAPGPMPRLITVPESDDSEADADDDTDDTDDSVDVAGDGGGDGGGEPVPPPLEPEPTRPAQLLPMDALLSGPNVAPPVLDAPVPRSSAVMPAIAADPFGARVVAGDRFARQIREQLAHGDHVAAARFADAALQLYPDDRSLRALAAVATAMAACARGDRIAAVAALEVATSSDPGCGEAATALAELRHAGVPTVAIIQRWFA